MTLINSSGENLLSFVNNASSCVKTVLAKPGCFKRNTNHRRFLQKQLKQNITSIKSPKTFDDKDEELKKNNESVKKNFRINKIKHRAIKKTKRTTVKDVYANGISFARVPSPTDDYLQLHHLNEATFYPELHPSAPSSLYYNTSTPFYNFEAEYEMKTNYQRSNSSSSYASTYASMEEDLFSPTMESMPTTFQSSENLGCSEYLTGEELLQELDVRDLYDPDNYEERFYDETCLDNIFM